MGAANRRIAVALRGEYLTRARGVVVERMAEIESLIDLIIEEHFVPGGSELSWSFSLDVLYDELFSLALKVSILKKICPELCVGKQSPIARLDNMRRIRNDFAHRAVLVKHEGDKDFWVPDPRKPDQRLDFDKALTKFELEGLHVEKALRGVLTSKGVKLETTTLP